MKREKRPTFSQTELREKNVYEVGRLRTALNLAEMEAETLRFRLESLERRNEKLLAEVKRLAEQVYPEIPLKSDQ